MSAHKYLFTQSEELELWHFLQNAVLPDDPFDRPTKAMMHNWRDIVNERVKKAGKHITKDEKNFADFVLMKLRKYEKYAVC